jgi:hypothetical protein
VLAELMANLAIHHSLDMLEPDEHPHPSFIVGGEQGREGSPCPAAFSLLLW